MRWAYAAFNGVILAGPLLISWLYARDFWRQGRAVGLSLALVGVPWIVLDIAAHNAGWWSYNTQFISGLRLFGLPLEEIAFFFVVPFACLVVWHVLRRVHGMVPVWLPRLVLCAVAATGAALMIVYWNRERTVIDALVAIITLAVLWETPLVRTRSWWYWNMSILALFFIFNTILTAAPVVTYNSAVMTGWRISTIPIEDMVYNFSLLNMSLLTFVRLTHQRVLAKKQM